MGSFFGLELDESRDGSSFREIRRWEGVVVVGDEGRYAALLFLWLSAMWGRGEGWW